MDPEPELGSGEYPRDSYSDVKARILAPNLEASLQFALVAALLLGSGPFGSGFRLGQARLG